VYHTKHGKSVSISILQTSRSLRRIMYQRVLAVSSQLHLVRASPRVVCTRQGHWRWCQAQHLSGRGGLRTVTGLPVQVWKRYWPLSCMRCVCEFVVRPARARNEVEMKPSPGRLSLESRDSRRHGQFSGERTPLSPLASLTCCIGSRLHKGLESPIAGLEQDVDFRVLVPVRTSSKTSPAELSTRCFHHVGLSNHPMVVQTMAFGPHHATIMPGKIRITR
jgi:hypothetical protein